jgi:predicted nucleic acid-binding protein
VNRRETFVDAGHWIALLHARDTLHQRALRLNAEIGGLLVTTDALLAEVGDWMARPPLRAQAITFLDRVHANPNVEIVHVDARLFARGVALYTARPDKEWGLTDCISFVVMEERGITEALAADIHFVQAGFRALLRE